MRRSVLVLLVLLVVLVQLPANASDSKIAATESSLVLSPTSTDSTSADPLQAQVDEGLCSSPTTFVENVGQFGEGARFQMWGGLGTTWLAEDAMWITLIEPSADGPEHESPFPAGEGQGEVKPRNSVNLKLSFVGANPHPRLEPYARLETKVSYFIGADPAKWHPDVPVWGGVRYLDLYPGVDLVVGKDEKGLHPAFPWRLVLREGAPLPDVRLRIEGADAVSLPSPGTSGEGQGEGHLLLTTALGEFSLPLLALEGLGPDGEARPLALDLTPRTLTPGPQLFEVSSPFALGEDDVQGEGSRLLAGPSDLLYATFLGGSDSDGGSGIAVGGSGQAYVTGWATSPDFPAASGPGYDTSHNGLTDAFVVKLNASGTALAYATFLGGSDSDSGSGIAVDGAGQAYVTGYTYSADFPAAGAGYDTTHNGSRDAFVVKLNASGTALAYATFLGGSDSDDGSGIAVDGAGQAYVSGTTGSTDFPAADGPGYDTSHNGGRYDAFVVKLSASGSALLYGTFLGGSEDDWGEDIAVDGAGQAYVSGYTESGNFPAASGPGYDTSYNGSQDAFVLKLATGGPTFTSPVRWIAGYGYSTGGWTSQDKYPRHVADVNGDGRGDVVGFGNAGVYVSLSTGTSFLAPSRWIAKFGYSTTAGGWTSQNLYPRMLGDVNKDGKADVVGFFSDGVYVSLSTGTSFGSPTRWIAKFGSSAAAGGWSSQDKYPRTLGDVNGDGRADIVGFFSDGVYVPRSTGTSFTTPTRWIAGYGYSAGGWTSQDKYPRFVADVNGDGKADVVGFAGSGVYVSLSTSTKFLAPTLWIAAFGYSAGGWTSQNLYPRMLADVNADNRADVIGFGNGGAYVSLSTGSSFCAATLGIASYGRSAGGWSSQNTYPRAVADVNHDHKADIVGFAGSGVYVSLCQ